MVDVTCRGRSYPLLRFRISHALAPLKAPEEGPVPMEVSTSEDQAMSVEKLNGSGPEQKSVPELVLPEAAEGPISELLKRYPHMNHDEPEKREWMADVPAAAAVSGQAAAGYTARFGFDGRLLDPSMKVIKFCKNKLIFPFQPPSLPRLLGY